MKKPKAPALPGDLFQSITSAIVSDLGGEPSEIETRLAQAFAGAVLLQNDLIARYLSGEKIDTGELTTIGLQLLRTELGIQRRPRLINGEPERLTRIERVTPSRRQRQSCAT
jgi:hypothetical protein